ncbi:MAG: hypothetical protein R3335_03940 [Anaerolineales bacterium]|nr:hypothetical protein [Anaerolineales bacterium]
MNIIKSNFRLLAFVALIMMIGLACNAVTGGATPTELPPTQPPPSQPPPTQAPESTLPPEPSNTLPAPTEEPTSAPQPTEAPVLESDLLSEDLYIGSEGVFEFYPPLDWDITAEDEASIWIEPTDFSGAIYMEVTNTDIGLDGESFERFIAARETSDFGSFDNYSEDYSFYESEDGFAVVEKSLDYEGIPQLVTTYYEQYDNVIFTIDFWADTDALADYQPMFDEFYFNAFPIPDMASALEPYLFVYDFFGPDDLFTIQVPTGWAYEMSEGDSTVVDTFFSPDEHAVIQNISFDDGQPVTDEEAGTVARDLITNFYAGDVEITNEEIQEDGSVRLTWNSPGDAFSGNSFYETRGTTFLLFTIMWDDEYEDVYFPILDYTVGSYEPSE